MKERINELINKINKGSKKLDDMLPVTTPPASNDKPKKLVGVKKAKKIARK